MHDELRIIHHASAALLQAVHERVLLVRIKGFVEAPRSRSAWRRAMRLQRINSFSLVARTEPTAA
jgi:ribosomal protein L30/L7E